MKIYQVFHTLPGAEGNFVAIDMQEQLAEEARPPLQAGHRDILPTDITRCHISNAADSDYLVTCQQRGHKIQCCGHGLLAAAHALFESGDYHQINLGHGISAQQARSSEGRLETWLTMPALDAVSIDIPPWTTQLFPSEKGADSIPIGAATTESDDGYLLLQMAAHLPLESVVVDTTVICANSAQALLLWQHCPEDESLVRMRYFAPQYGNREDAATGSVLRVLGPFVRITSGLKAFTVCQCSAAGGRMSIRNMRDCVAITGNVRLIDSKDLPAEQQKPH